MICNPHQLFTMRTSVLFLTAVVVIVALIDVGLAGDCNCECKCDGECKQKTHESNVKEIERQQKKHEENVKIIEEKQEEHEENVKKWIKAHYCKQEKEDEREYFKRICQKKNDECDQEYVKRLILIREYYPNLDLWYNDNWLCESRNFYTKVYYRQSHESDEHYFQRLLKKESCEDDDHWAKRVNVLRVVYPQLSLWSEECYYNTLTNKYYKTYYKQGKKECCKNYIKRVFQKVDGEDETHFWKRVKLVQKTFPDCKCWKKKRYFKDCGVCSCLLKVKNEEELKKKIEEEKKNGKCKCKESKLDAVKKIFSKIVKKGSSSSSSSSEEK